MDKDKKGKYFVEKIKDVAKERGWFFGQFMDNNLLKSDLFEVAWNNISNKKVKNKHFHKESVEMNIVISGEVSLKINGEEKKISKGEFYVIYPETIVEDFEAGDNTEIIVVRAPSINDKQIIQ